MAGEQSHDQRRSPRGRDTQRAPQRNTRSGRAEDQRGGDDRTRREPGRGERERRRDERGQRRPPGRHDDRPRTLGPRIPAQPPRERFTCGHCGHYVGPLPSGGHHRNHCPFCLYSRHVDAGRSGDRANPCGGLMAPIGAFQRRNGEHVVVHRCEKCGFERFNRIAADDDFDLVLALPVVAPRNAGQEQAGP